MPLKRSNNYLAIATTIFIAVLLIGSEIVFAAHLILAGNWKGNINQLGLALAPVGLYFLILPVFATIFVVAATIGLISRARMLGGTLESYSRLLDTAPNQPDQHLALQPGERLILERRRSIGNILRLSLLLLGFTVLFAASGAIIVFALLPVFSHSTLNPFYNFFFFGPASPLSAITPLDWFTAAFPLALSLLLLVFTPYIIIDQRYILTADEQGLTLKRRLRRRNFIRWNDILLFIDSGKNRSGRVTETYLLLGQEYRFTFEIVRLPESPNPQQKKRASSPDKLDSYRYAGGFEQYTADAQRLLATIAARSHAPLQTYTRMPALVEKIKQHFPSRLMLDDLVEAPLAGKELQPKVQDTAADLAAFTITLKERLPLRSLLLETFAWFIPIGTMFFVCSFVMIPETLSSLSSFWLAVVVAVMVALSALLAYGAAMQPRRSRVPVVIASPDGLTRKTENKETTITLPWGEMRAWAIKLSPDHTQSQRTYVVCSERATLTWTERADTELAGRGIQGGRRQAYQEQAEQLHSLIAARTGLPLREVTNRHF